MRTVKTERETRNENPFRALSSLGVRFATKYW